MTEKKNVSDQVLDALVYLPVGAVLAARDEMPRLAAKGKAFVSTQLTMARTVGNFAVTFGSREAEKQMLKAVRRLGSLWGEHPIGRVSGSDAEPVVAESTPHAPADEGRAQPVRSGTSSNGNSAHLAIVGYDSLSASQVVQRLAGLAPGELEAVRDYEARTRSRATILNRASQLLSGTPGS